MQVLYLSDHWTHHETTDQFSSVLSLECEVKGALESITTTKLVDVMEFQLSYFTS